MDDGLPAITRFAEHVGHRGYNLKAVPNGLTFILNATQQAIRMPRSRRQCLGMTC